jgi:prolyl-tRNA editing enzyme YbaK/EbsC (Cys-tRNA(Pro) deacylase)
VTRAPVRGYGSRESAELEQTSFARTRARWKEVAPAATVLELNGSHPTIMEAASALGVEPAQVAKTLLVEVAPSYVVLVMPGDARLDNRKFRDRFGVRPCLSSPHETERITGQPVGGVGPVGHLSPLPVFCDRGLLGFALVYPAAGSRTRVVETTPGELAICAGAEWVDVCAVVTDVSATSGA